MEAYEAKVDIDIFKYQEKVKLISQFQTFFSFFNGLLEFASLPWNNYKNTKNVNPMQRQYYGLSAESISNVGHVDSILALFDG